MCSERLEPRFEVTRPLRLSTSKACGDSFMWPRVGESLVPRLALDRKLWRWPRGMNITPRWAGKNAATLRSLALVFERRHRLLAPIMTRDKFIKISLELMATHTV